jgi:hypothetical protein
MMDPTRGLGTDGLGVPAHFADELPIVLPVVPAPREAPRRTRLPSTASLTALAPWARGIEVPGMDCEHHLRG